MNHLEEINAVLPKLLRKKKPIMTIELSEKDIEDLKILIDYVLWTWFESKNRVNRDFARKISEEKRQLVKTLQTNASV